MLARIACFQGLIWDLLKFAHMRPKEKRPTDRRTRRTSTKHALDSAAPGVGHPRSVSLKWVLPFVEILVGDVKSPSPDHWRQKSVAFSSHRFCTFFVILTRSFFFLQCRSMCGKIERHFQTQVKRPDQGGRTNTRGLAPVLKSRFCTRAAVEELFEKTRATLPQGASQRERGRMKREQRYRHVKETEKSDSQNSV